MKKKWIACLLLGCLLFSLSAPALADVIWEPDDAFYFENSENAAYVNRSFYVNGSEGATIVWDTPEKKQVVTPVRNGEVLYVSFTLPYGGEAWGIVQFVMDAGGAASNNFQGTETNAFSGWVRMQDMTAVYDYVSFEEEYGAKFYEYENGYPGLQATDEELVLWTFPGSGETAGTLWNAGDLEIFTAFLDEAGNEWGFVAYYMGRRNVWVCLSDPVNTALPALYDKTPTLTKANPDWRSLADDAKQKGGVGVWLIVVLVAIVVLVSALLIKRTAGKQKKPSRVR